MFERFSEADDLSRVSRELNQRNIAHRFVLSGSEQQLLLLHLEDADIVKTVLEQWRLGKLTTHETQKKQYSAIRLKSAQAPLTLLLVFLGFSGAALAAFGTDFIRLFTFWDPVHYLDFSLYGANPWVDIQTGEYWRLITPIFLHFGPVHIVFNALWIWYLGTLVERHQGWVYLLSLALIIGITSNSVQAILTEAGIFGGLSGVVYGLFAYTWVFGRLNPGNKIVLPDILFIVVTVLMLISPLGVFDIIAGGEIADAAHISGYLCGAFLALAVTFINKGLKNIGS